MYVLGVVLRNRVFPLSWVVQQRTADIATIVDENVNGVRVVKSFAAERREINQLAEGGTPAAVGQHRDGRCSRALCADHGEPAAVRPGRRPAYGGTLVIDGDIQLGALVAFNAYILMMQTPFRLLGFFLMLQHRAACLGRTHLRDARRTSGVVERPGAIDLVDPDGRVEFRRRPVRLCATARMCSTDVDLTIEPGEVVRTGGSHR